MTLDAPRLTITFSEITVSRSMRLYTGLGLEGLSALLGLSKDLPTRKFAFLALLTAPLRLPLSPPPNHELAWTTLSRKSSMEDNTSLRNLFMSSADETAIVLEIGDGETN